MPVRVPRKSFSRHARQTHRGARRRLLAESLEDRRLLAVTFEFNYIGGNSIGFNDPVRGTEFRSALEAAGNRLGGWLQHDATIQFDVESHVFTGTAVAHARSALPPELPNGGFLPTVVTQKVLGEPDANGAVADGFLEVFFFGPGDSFTYITDPAEADANDEIDFQALAIHEILHTLGFTSATTMSGSDDSGDGINAPGEWRPFDQFLSDVDGNRFIDADPDSPTAFRMDTTAWAQHSVGGKGPNAGLFFDGPIATAVYGSRVPLYSPSTFSVASSVAHLDSEGVPDNNPIFSPLTHLLSHALVDGSVPQELTLVEKAMFADMGVLFEEDTLPNLTPPANIELEGNAEGGFSGTNATLDAFRDGAVATDLFDPDVEISVSIPTFLPLGQTSVEFTATDASGNQATASATITVIDSTAPTIDVSPTQASFEATSSSGISGVTLPFVASASDLVDPAPSLTFNPAGAYPIGTTTETYTARDATGNQSTVDVQVVVEDTTPPEFSLPTLVIVPSNIASGADLSNAALQDLLSASASDTVDATITFGASESLFPIGTTAVTFTAADDSGNVASVETLVTVAETSFVVTTLDDELDPDASANPDDLSLREAISLANEAAGSDVIFFDQGLSGVVFLDNLIGQLEITDPVTIVGNGRDNTTIDALGASRVFDISAAAGDVVLSGMTITGGELTADEAAGAGVRMLSPGLLTINDSTITGNTISGEAAIGAGINSRGGDVTLRDTTLSDNTAEGLFGPGGGLWMDQAELTMIRSRVSGNAANGGLASGGGVYVLDGMATITQSTITRNETGASRSGGGGLAFLNTDAVIRDSTISDNFTFGGESHGGGLRVQLGTLDIVNSTISGNSTIADDSDGGGLFVQQSDVNIDHSTFTANDAGGVGGGVSAPRTGDGSTLTIENSIVADNSDDGTAPDLVGAPLAGGTPVRFSLIGDNTGSSLNESQTPDPITGNLVGDPNGGGLIDPLLAPLADNGGLTESHALDRSSPAIDAGDPGFDPTDFSPTLENDQRGDGFTRLSGSAIDLGAVEATGGVTITWANPQPIVFGTPLDGTQLNATADVPGTFVYTPTAGSVLNAGTAQALSVEFTPDDLASFEVTTATVFLDVLRADPVVTWQQPDPIVFGTPLDGTQLNATANIDGTFVYSPTFNDLLSAGNDQLLNVTFTPTDTTNYNTATASVSIDVLTATPSSPGKTLIRSLGALRLAARN